MTRFASEMSEEPSTSTASSVPKLSTLSRDSVTSCTSWRVITALPVCLPGDTVALGPVPAQANVIGSVGVPDLAIVTDWGLTTELAAEMTTVWPGSTTFAAAWTVQNGSACVPGPLSLHVPLNSTY